MTNINRLFEVSITPTQKLFTFDNPRFDADVRSNSNINNNYNNDGKAASAHVSHKDDKGNTDSNNTANAQNHLFCTINVHQSRANATSTGVV